MIALSGVLNRRLAKQIPEEEYSYLAVIERNGKQRLELINDILDLSRIEAGREEIEVSRFDINDRETILSYGFDGYIAKPIDQIEFNHTIQQVLYGKE